MKDEIYDQLYSCIKYGRLEAVAEYLDNGGNPNLTNRNGWSLLMAAAFKGAKWAVLASAQASSTGRDSERRG